MSMVKEFFGIAKDGKDVYTFTLKNANGMKARVMNFGAVLVNLYVPDKNGNLADVVLGYDKLEDYYGNESFFGVTIGPSANRVGNASFRIDGRIYQLDINDGVNNLHSNKELGYHKRVWDIESADDNSVTFSITAPDGDMGFPGNKKISMTYSLSDDNKLTLAYHGTSDANTLINMTNHTYFNLSGHQAGSIEDHLLTIHASHYTPVIPGAIPTGEIAPVAGTPMDFTSPKPIGRDIRDDFEQLKLTFGYDHNFVIDGADGTLREIAVVEDPKSDRKIKAFSTLPGVQFYAGNCIEEETGKDGTLYGARMGMCLETQYFPDSINKPEFPSVVFGPDRDYEAVTVYQFLP
ncbi:MAG: galactose mutarotase [Clostridium sp.]|nr:galactose mutarotase [Lachnoclostridium sp.]MCM1253895.1 galactose mutarotase [Clostridium sp.]